VITYANNPPQFSSYLKYLQNRICTVADSFRVADDFGKLRCQLTYFNRPIFGWKGSYVVCNVSFLNRFPPLYLPTLGWCWEEGQLWLGPRGLQGGGLLLRYCGSGPGLHLQLHRGGDAREVSLHLLWLHQAEEAVDAGNILGLRLSPYSPEVQVPSLNVTWSLAHHPTLHLKLGPLQTLPDESWTDSRLHHLLYWCHGSLHVHLWIHQTVQCPQILISSNVTLVHRDSRGLNSQVWYSKILVLLDFVFSV